MRTTKANVESAFEHLCKATGNVEKWELDYIACYGGYVIVETATGKHPFGLQRMDAATFYTAAWFAIRAIESTRVTERQ